MVQYMYDAWGNHKIVDRYGNTITSSTHIGIINPIRYRSYYYDTETGLYYLQARYYDPVIGRFISPDDVDYIDPEVINGLNLYAYCGNNPVMNVDPTGHDWWKWLIGALIIVAAIVVTIATAGAATGTIVAAIHTIATNVMIGSITTATINTLAGGLTYENGQLKWDWAGAADGFMWGSINGAFNAISGTIGANISKSFTCLGEIGKVLSFGAKATFNVGVPMALSALQGIVNNDFSWENSNTSTALQSTKFGLMMSTKLFSNSWFDIGFDIASFIAGEWHEQLNSKK